MAIADAKNLRLANDPERRARIDLAAGSKRATLEGHVLEAHKPRPSCIVSARCHRQKGSECDAVEPSWQKLADRRYRCHWRPAELRQMQAQEEIAV